MKKKIMAYNSRKIGELRDKIRDLGDDYTILSIDVDGVVYNTSIMQEILEEIDFRSTKKYRSLIANEETEDFKIDSKKSYAILNAILEETPFQDDENMRYGVPQRIVYPKIDYKRVYKDENFVKNAETGITTVDYIRHIMENKPDNVFVIFNTHYNMEHESFEKIKELYRLFPNIDGIIAMPYHKTIGSNECNNKADKLRERLGKDVVRNVIHIDDLKKNCTDIRESGGMDIRFLEFGYDDTHTLGDRFTRIANLDPYYLSFVISYIEFKRKYPEYEMENECKVLRKK